jgi:hypothetical protein
VQTTTPSFASTPGSSIRGATETVGKKSAAPMINGTIRIQNLISVEPLIEAYNDRSRHEN